MAIRTDHNNQEVTSNGSVKQRDSKGRVKGSCLRILIHLLLILAVSFLLIWGVMIYLKVYTRFGDAVEVPKITGLSRTEAERTLKDRHLKMEIIDSVYVDGAAPGVVMDLTPKEGSKVKSRRVVFVTVNALTSRTISLPQVLQLSVRQAEATLRGAGFTNVAVKYVPGEFNDLVVSVLDGTSGAKLIPGKKVAEKQKIVLEVSSAVLLDSLNMVQEALLEDSLTRIDTSHPIDSIGPSTVTVNPVTDPKKPIENPQPQDPDLPDPDDWF